MMIEHPAPAIVSYAKYVGTYVTIVLFKSLQVVVHAVTSLEVEVKGGSWSKEADAGRGGGCIWHKRTGLAI